MHLDSAQVTPRRAFVATLGVSLASFAFVVAISDPPLSERPHEARRRSVAALAVRDHVVPFQKWGTEMFTLPALRRHYDEVAYFTRRWHGDRTLELLAALRELLTRHERVDLFVLAHSNALIAEVETLPPELTRRLRLVYDTGCADAAQAEEWRSVGADVYLGHPGRASISPVFYFYFLRRWEAGWTVADAASDANRKTVTRLRWAAPIAEGVVGPLDIVASTVAEMHGDGEVWLAP
jgi:hypothetical protein